MFKFIPPVRGTDSKGSGEYLAPRGKRKHRGIDLACYPKSGIFPNVSGEVTKLGYTYSDDLSFRYVQVTDLSAREHRYFYVEPCVDVGDWVDPTVMLGLSQKLGDRFPGITEHIHYEVKEGGKFIDPGDFI